MKNELKFKIKINTFLSKGFITKFNIFIFKNDFKNKKDFILSLIFCSNIGFLNNKMKLNITLK